MPATQRVAKTILRGKYESIIKGAEEGSKRVWGYLVATDLRGEGQHALKWTIRAVLRDGDTLIAIYAIGQDTVGNCCKIVPDDRIVRGLSSQTAAVGTSLAAMNRHHTPATVSPLSNIGDISERSRERTIGERKRYVAAEAVIRQIDLMEPTLVVLDPRDRSALEGILLGCFSNYLVTKSSVPLMAARKKLKHTKRFAKTNV
ncbi:unnamed protein product, partial [Tuber aestivum]